MNKDMESIRDEWRELRSRIGNLVCAVDGKVESCEALDKKMQEKKDESYLKGAEDMREVLKILLSPDISYGMPMKEIADIFGTAYNSSILEKYSASEIINKVNQWKEEKEKLKETEFKVGDEVEHSDHINGSCNKYIVIKADSDSSVLWLLDLRTFLRIWIYKDDSSLKKTGKHFDTIDIPEGGATI